MIDVILLQDVTGIGKKGERHTVKDGFGINFLLPKGLATRVGTPKAHSLEQNVKALQKKQEQIEATHIATAQKWDGQTISLSPKSGPNGKLFGSVSAADIAKELGVERTAVNLPHPIRQKGTYSVELQFSSQTRATIQLHIE